MFNVSVFVVIVRKKATEESRFFRKLWFFDTICRCRIVDSQIVIFVARYNHTDTKINIIFGTSKNFFSDFLTFVFIWLFGDDCEELQGFGVAVINEVVGMSACAVKALSYR